MVARAPATLNQPSTTPGDDGKGILVDCLAQEAFWRLLGAEFPGFFDASQCESLKDLMTSFDGQGLVAIDCAEGEKQAPARRQEPASCAAVPRQSPTGGPPSGRR